MLPPPRRRPLPKRAQPPTQARGQSGAREARSQDQRHRARQKIGRATADGEEGRAKPCPTRRTESPPLETAAPPNRTTGARQTKKGGGVVDPGAGDQACRAADGTDDAPSDPQRKATKSSDHKKEPHQQTDRLTRLTRKG
jgi:hypothetical protein